MTSFQHIHDDRLDAYYRDLHLVSRLSHRKRIERYLREGLPVSGASIGNARAEVTDLGSGQSPIVAPFMRTRGWVYTTVAGASVGVGGAAPITATFTGPTFSAATIGPPPEPVLAQIVTNSAAATTSELFSDGDVGVGGIVGDGYPLSVFRQVSFRARLDTPTFGRYYWGVCLPANSSTTRFSTDSLNFDFAGFRFSAGTDNTLQLYLQQGASPPGIVATTIVPDAVPVSHQYTMTFDGTSFRFYFDTKQIPIVLSNTSFFPNTGTLSAYFSVDNKNTAHQCGLSMSYSMTYLL